jgi:hypothetical protein
MKMIPYSGLQNWLVMAILSVAFTATNVAADPRDAQFFDEGDAQAPKLETEVPKRFGSKLEIGGQLYLQSDVTMTPDRPLVQSPFHQQALLYVYLDQQPSSQTRVFAKGSLIHPLSAPTGTLTNQLPGFTRDPARIEELWLKMNVDQRLFITLGTQPVRWGVSRIWNPTDFLNERQKDPLAIFDDRPGLACAKLHIPIESTGTNLYLFLRPGVTNQLDALRYSARVEQIWGLSEWSVSADLSHHTPVKLGSDLSIGVGPIDLKAELATRSTASSRLWSGDFNLTTAELPTEEPATHWPIQWTMGAEWALNYDDKRSLFLTVEYFRNPLGYQNNAQLYPWLIAQGDYTPLYVGQSYLGVNLAFPGLGEQQDQTILMSGIANLSDRTTIIRLDYQVTVLTRVRLSAYAATYLGELGEFHYPYEIPAGVAGEASLAISPPSLSTGLWTSVAF